MEERNNGSEDTNVLSKDDLLATDVHAIFPDIWPAACIPLCLFVDSLKHFRCFAHLHNFHSHFQLSECSHFSSRPQ